MNWTPLTNIEQLKTIQERSFHSPIVIFKHSTRCSISAMAYSRLERSWDEKFIPQNNLFYLDLITYRDISNQVASLFNIAHESPQVIVIFQGKAVYDDSHMSIRFDAIKDAVQSAVA